MNSRIDFLREKAGRLTLDPGVYIMKNEDKEIIYIGKAKVLKRRVSQYFQNNQKNLKVEKMVENVYDFDYIVTDTESEALILESSLIKQHMPKYNILLKDDKGYHYFKITNEDYPRIETVHKKEKGKDRYIGPYYSSFIVNQTIEETRKMFKLPTCKRSFSKKTRPCLNYHIGICSAPCAHKISKSDYRESVEEAINYIKHGAVESVKELTQKMNEASEKLQYEKAAKFRDKIIAIKKVKENQKITSTTVKNQDIIAYAVINGKICFDILKFKNGKLFDNNYYIYKNWTDDDVISEFLIQYYENSEIPPQISVFKDFEGRLVLQDALSKKREKGVKIVIPQKGEQKKLCDMCEKNAIEHLTEKTKTLLRNKKPLIELTELLNLKDVPERIESYDISNTAGSENVGGMIVYENGQKAKSDYRKFKIKSFVGQDDYKSLDEVLRRRFEEYKKGTDKSFSKLPSLILMDGGKGQLSVALKVLSDFNLEISVFGMVKDDKHRTRGLISADGDEVELKSTKNVFTFVTEIQDEVHNFAISYHRKRRKLTSTESSFLSIDGVGEKRRVILFNHFKTLQAMKNATLEEIANVKGIDKLTAQNIYNFLHQDD